MTGMTDEKNRPSLWIQALKVVKGDTTSDMVEQFTSEMTLVAEGLCEDQARLRNAVDGLIRDAQNNQNDMAQELAHFTQRLDTLEGESARQFKELSRRLDALEKPAKRRTNPKALFSGDWMGRATLLAAIICGTWVVVTILKLFM